MIVRVITGAAGFVGRAIAAHLASVPGRLLLVDNRPIEPLAEAESIVCDCRGPEFAALLTEALPGAERAELFAVAGHVGGRFAIGDTDLASFSEAVAGNLAPAYAAARGFAETASAAGVPGSITFAGSVGAVRAHRYQAGYDAAKAGVRSLGRSFALGYASKGITTRVVELGPIAQSATSAADGERAPALVRLVPRGRYATVEEIAEAVAAFAGPAFDVATGTALPLDGGLIQQLRPADVERPPEPAVEANPGEGARSRVGRIGADHAGSLTSQNGASFGFVRPDAS